MFTAFLLVFTWLPQGQSKQEQQTPAFDSANMERTAIYLTRWQVAIDQAKRKAESTGNAIEYQELHAKFTKEMSDHVGKEVKWPIRFETAAQSQFGKTIVTFETEYYWQKSRAGMYVFADSVGESLANQSERQQVEPWMKSLRRGSYVWAKAKVKEIADGPRVILEQTFITPYSAPVNKRK